MKKVVVLLVAIIYLGVSSGVAMTIHYCMGKIASVDLMHNSKKCGKCGMKAKFGGCCKDEYKIVKLSDSHKNITNDIKVIAPAIIDSTYIILNSNNFSSEIISDLNNNSPPIYMGISLNILYSVFRI